MVKRCAKYLHLRGKGSFLKKASILGITTCILFSLSGCLFIPKEEEVLAPPLKEPPKIVYDTVEVKKGNFVKKDNCTGSFISVQQKDMSFENRGGRLKKIHVKLGDQVKKGSLLAELDTDTLESQIKQEEIAVQKLQMIYDTKEASQDSKFNITLAKLDLDAEKLKFEELKQEYAKSRLVSPIDGTIDYIVDNVKEGDYINAYVTVVRVADQEDLQVQYTGDKIGDFELGAKVQLKVNENEFEGEVVMTPSNTPLDADEKTKQSIRIKVNKMPKDVKIGISVDITLVLVKKDDVIVIPKNMIHTLGQRKYVNVLENGLKKEQDIEVGEENQTESEITKGLVEGEKVINN